MGWGLNEHWMRKGTRGIVKGLGLMVYNEWVGEGDGKMKEWGQKTTETLEREESRFGEV